MGLLYETVDQEFLIQEAIHEIKSTYGDEVSVDEKKKTLLKFGESEAIGTTKATVAQMPAGQLHETMLSDNTILKVCSDDNSDTMNVNLVEGHTIADGDLTFHVDNDEPFALTGFTDADLPRGYRDVTRARLASPAAGNIYFHTGGATTNGVPNDLSTVKAMIPAGEIQTQKAQTALSSRDYFIILTVTLGMVEKTAGWIKGRIEIKPVASGQDWYPLTQWIPLNAGDPFDPKPLAPYKIVPKNYDVRIVAVADGASTNVTAAMDGVLATIRS